MKNYLHGFSGRLKSFIKQREYIKYIPLLLIIFVATYSFLYGWNKDHSKPISGIGWADQNTYLIEASQIAGGHFLTADQMHFSVGYPLMGAVGHIFSPNDPFFIVSYLLLISSVILCYFAVRKMWGPVWGVIFCLLLIAWDGYAKSFNFSSELFAIPWNNQVLFFTMAYYFWLFVTKLKKNPSWTLIIVTSVISGWSFLTREESIIFVIPMLAIFLYLTKAGWRKTVVSFAIFGICYLPQLIFKLAATGTLTKSGRSIGYTGVRDQYLQPKLFYRNVWETIIDSRHFGALVSGRKALLQAAPWLWLSPIGIGLVLALKRYSLGLKIFVLASSFLMLFYLSGANMSGHKLKFHCLRYISPAFIALNIGVVVVAKEAYDLVSYKVVRTRKSGKTV